ncbi:MAG TPA: EamA family transporter [Methylomirabilota bacterium]|nr:EamA family transporter [Methylomirabilota bacterium]
MAVPYLILLVANLVFATGYSVSRIVLADVGPATLGLARVLIGAVLLLGWAAWRSGARPRVPWTGGDRVRVALMGVVGFALAFAFGNWGLAHSTASNAALLITVEPTTLLALSPLLLGERLSRRETIGAALTLVGAVLVVVNGVPGLTRSLMPHWRGDLVLILSGIAYAAYSLLGRGVLSRHPVAVVTAHSVVWGAISITPLALYEWRLGPPPAWTPTAIAGTLYMGVVITALGYGVWNWCLERVGAARVAGFVNLQPLAGALLGVWWLREPLTPFLATGGVLIVAGLHLTVKAGRRG